MPTCSVRGDGSTPRRGWHLWRFASLIPSGCRLPPIHKVMGDHASRGPTPAGACLLRHVDLLVGEAALLGTEAHYMAFDGSIDGAGKFVRILP